MLGSKKSTGLVSRVSRKKSEVRHALCFGPVTGRRPSLLSISRHRYTVSLDFILASDIQ